VSIEIYQLVESLQWDQAHLLSGLLVLFAFLVILSLLLADWRIGRGRT
jgi:ABC-type molybdate transport system permease subunit